MGASVLADQVLSDKVHELVCVDRLGARLANQGSPRLRVWCARLGLGRSLGLWWGRRGRCWWFRWRGVASDGGGGSTTVTLRGLPRGRGGGFSTGSLRGRPLGLFTGCSGWRLLGLRLRRFRGISSDIFSSGKTFFYSSAFRTLS
jgi:hypothetical protein